MKSTMKKLLLVVCACVLIMGFTVPASAASGKPSATPQFGTSLSVRRGYRYSLRFMLDSRTYSSSRGYYRSRFDIDMFDSKGRRVGYTNYYYFSGRCYLTVKWSFPSGIYKRNSWYTMRARTQYRFSASSRYWYTASTKTIKFYVR